MTRFLELENHLRATEKCPRTGDILSPHSAYFRLNPLYSLPTARSRLAGRAAFCGELTVEISLQWDPCKEREKRDLLEEIFLRFAGWFHTTSPLATWFSFARILPANNADWAIFSGFAG